MLSASSDDDKIAWYENLTADGNPGVFATQQVITTAADGVLSVYAADLDGDGDLDVLSASFHDDKIAWYENLGDPCPLTPDEPLCDEINECEEGMDNCDPLVDCINTPYSFACGYCPSGYVDSYRDRTRCDDIDECGDGTHNCDALATCTNNPGSFACGGCPAGYADTNSDGTLCDDIDECADPFTCNANATCQNSTTDSKAMARHAQ